MMQEPLAHRPTGAYATYQGLHTESLHARYGSIHPVVLSHDDGRRIAALADGKGIWRTFAFSDFTGIQHSERVAAANRIIRSGGLIGQTFKDLGFEIRKNVLDVAAIDVPDWLSRAFAHSGTQAKVRFTEFLVRFREAGLIEHYASVAEIDSPDFAPPKVSAEEANQVTPSSAALQWFGVWLPEVWNRMSFSIQYDLNDPWYKNLSDRVKDEQQVRMRRVRAVLAERDWSELGNRQ